MPARPAAPPAGPLPVVELRWTIDADLVRSTIGRVLPRPLDPALALPPLPAGLQKSLLGLLERKGAAGDAGLTGAYWHLGPEKPAADLEALVRKLEPLCKNKAPKPAAALLVAGWLVEQRGLAPARGGAWYDRAAGAYAAAAAAAPPGSDLAHHARYRLAMLQWREAQVLHRLP